MGANKNQDTTPQQLSMQELLEMNKTDYAALEAKYNVIVIELNDLKTEKDAIAKLLEQKELVIVDLNGKNAILTNAAAEYEKVITSLKETQQIQEGLIKELQQELTAAENNTLIIQDVPTVKHEGEVYEVHARSFRLDGTDHTIESLKDPVIVGRLLEKQVGFLIKK